MQHVHFDLDQTEAAIRRMFAEVRTQPKPEGLSKDALFVAGWQDRSEDLLIAFMRFALTMENEGVDPARQGYTLGVVLADCASQYLSAFENGSLSPTQAILTGFTGHLNQCIQAQQTNSGHAASVDLVKMQSGTA